MVAPGLSARIGSTPKTKFRGDPDFFGRLVEDHDRHRALLAMIQETHGQPEDRTGLFEELVRKLKAHAAAEEQALWSTVLRDPATTDSARHAVAELKPLAATIATFHIGDPVGARDSWRPWRRRGAAKREPAKVIAKLRAEDLPTVCGRLSPGTV